MCQRLLKRPRKLLVLGSPPRTRESQARSSAVTELHKDVAWLPGTGQFWQGAAWIRAVSLQGCWEKPACERSGPQSHPRVLIPSFSFLPASPQPFRTGAVSWRAPGAMSSAGYLSFLEQGGLGGLPALLRAWRRVRRAVSPASSARDRPWEYDFPAAAQSLETWPHWQRRYSCGLSLATLESRTRNFSLTRQSGGLACGAMC